MGTRGQKHTPGRNAAGEGAGDKYIIRLPPKSQNF
jgi:hypothetical protein